MPETDPSPIAPDAVLDALDVAELPPGFTVEFNVPLDSLVPHPRNPRKGNKAKIRQSIRENGFADVVIAQTSSRHMLSGNHRAKCAAEEGYAVAPIVIWADVDDQRALAMLLAYNRSADDAEYQRDVLLDIIRELEDSTIGLDASLYEHDDIEELRRLTGEISREATAFLDDYNPTALGGAQESAGGWTPTDSGLDKVFNLTFPFDEPQRERALAVLNAGKRQFGTESSSVALLGILDEWMAGHGEGD